MPVDPTPPIERPSESASERTFVTLQKDPETPSPSAAPATGEAEPAATTGTSKGAPPGDSSTPAPPRGFVVPGYEILGELGHGGMGVVYKARQIKADRLVAIKMILGSKHASVQEKVRFQIEAEAIARLQHPNIVQLHDVGEHEGLPFFSLEFCDGGALDGKLRTWTPTAAEAAVLVETLARAMHYAHLRGVVHRDLKPANVLLSSRRESVSSAGTALAGVSQLRELIPKITDFGLAKRLDSGNNISRSGAIMGTPSYMAPEQAEGKVHDTGPAADVYALGALLYELLVGRPPFVGETAFDTIRKLLTEEPTPPSRSRPSVPPDLETICLTCLNKEPSQRYASAEALADDLHRLQQGEPIAARPVGKIERFVKWMKRRPAVAAVLALAVALGAVIVVGFAIVASQLQETKEALKREEAAKRAREREETERKKAERERSLSRVNALRSAAPGAVPAILADLHAASDEVLPRLRELWAEQNGATQQRMRVGLALLPAEPEAVRDELADFLLKTDDPAEALLIRDALVPHRAELRDRFWAKADDAAAKPEERFRVLIGLAAFDPGSERWAKAGPIAVERMLAANPLHLGIWVQALRPVRGSLLTPLSEVYRTAKSPERREFAATVLADFAADRPETLADLLLDADAKQYALLLPVMQRYREQAVERMRREVRGEGYWDDPPLNRTGTEPSAELRREIEAADGLLAERWALCQTLPLERWLVVAAGLRANGYRPIRLRPFVQGETTRVAAVWLRDGREWKAESGLTADAVKEREAANRQDGFLPVDAAGYGSGEALRYAVLWVKPAVPGETARLYVNLSAMEHKDVANTLRSAGYIPSTVQVRSGSHSSMFFTGVWWKVDALATVGISYGNEAESAHVGRLLMAEKLLVDVDICSREGMCFSTVWHSNAAREAVETHGLATGAHLERCRELAAQGYRPAALSVALVSGKTLTASVWHRPNPKQDERERLARRQATGAATLLTMNAPTDALLLFRQRPDPEARSQFVWRCGQLSVDPNMIVRRLDEEMDVSARRALILTLGEYTEAKLVPDVRGPLTAKLLDWYRNDPDPGIHGAIDWLLRHGKEGPEQRPLDWGLGAKLKQIDGELRRRAPDKSRRWYVNGQGQTMVVVPGPVEFRMGSPLTEIERRQDETAHRRRIGRSFAIASKSISVEQWQRFLNDRPNLKHTYEKRFSPDTDGPIISISWYEAAQYCNWLSEKEGIPESEWCYPNHDDIKEGMKPYSDYLARKGYRLPTEAEWEYSCRAGTVSSRSYGTTFELLSRYAWFLNGSQERTWPVGQKRPNDLGLFDMHGNVWNWIQESVWEYEVSADGKAVEDREDEREVRDQIIRGWRGGSFHYRPTNVRSACRSNDRPSYRHFTVGLRAARTIP